MTFLGLDLGTSGLRALLVDGDGRPVASVEKHYPVSNPHPGWSEQDPAQWIEALEGAVAELAAAHPGLGGLRGIGVAGHMHGATLLDAQGAVIRPWHDWHSSNRACTSAGSDSRVTITAWLAASSVGCSLDARYVTSV